MTQAKLKRRLSHRLKRLLNFFLKGLLISLPAIITYQMVKSLVHWIDTFLELDTPGLGFVIVISAITFIGFIGTSFITKPFLDMLDDMISKIPFVKIIYSSVKDMVEAFVGEKKKFSKPVLVELGDGIYKPGFITQDDLTEMDKPGLVAVYLPHSYAFSGNLFLVDRNRLHVYDGNSTDFMKFIVSGGITTMQHEQEKDS